jgi:hypothetical protein
VAYVLTLIPFAIALSFVPGWSENPPAWLFAVWLVLAGLLIWMWRSVRGARGDRRRAEIVAALAQPRLERPPLLCVHVAGDEPRLGIRAVTTLATPDLALGERLGRIYETGFTLVGAGMVLMIVLVALGSIALLRILYPALIVGGALLVVLPYLLRVQLESGAPYSRLVQSLALGPERITDVLLVRTRTTATPLAAAPGVVEEAMIRLAGTRDGYLRSRRAAALRHFLPYAHAEALAAIQVWLAKRASSPAAVMTPAGTAPGTEPTS